MTRYSRGVTLLITVLLALLYGCGDASSNTGAVITPTKATTAPTTIAKITDAQKRMVSDILTKSIQHYQGLLAQGKSVLGTTQYADATAGIAAFNDPNSAASKFSAWRASSNAERDLSFIDAFKKADAFYNADNEPDAISAWRDDMSTAQSDLSQWITVAVSWQTRDKTTDELTAAQTQFEQDMKQAQTDVTNTLAAS